MENNKNVILEVKGLKKYFPIKKDVFGRPLVNLRAVDNVTFELEAGKTIGVVGESGCGKTTLGRTILQLYDTTGGKTLYYGHKVEEVLPQYYVKGIKELPNLKKKYYSCLNKLSQIASNLEGYSQLVNKEQLTMAAYNNLNNQIEAEIKNLDADSNKEKLEQLNKLSKSLIEIVNVLDSASSTTGSIILSNSNKGLNVVLKKLYKQNEYYIANTKRNDIAKKLNSNCSEEERNNLNKLLNNIDDEIRIIISDLNLINNELASVKCYVPESELSKELEANIESGLNLAKLTKQEMRKLRTEIQLIFQDPYSSLPPRMTIGQILTEPVLVHKIVEKDKVSEHVHKVMKMCGLQPQYYDRYPHEFSGGQRQRICIARALVVNPKLVICDEPVSALDVSIQAQIINLLKELQKDLGLTYMFISHDLSVVKYITDSIIVMYLGNMMEIGDTKDIFQNPLHPYTQALFSAVPVPDPDAKMNRIILKGDIPSPANPPKGCKFHTRCEKCMGVCKLLTPKFIQYDDKHLVACHLYDNEVMANLEKYDIELAEIENKEQEKLQALETNK